MRITLERIKPSSTIRSQLCNQKSKRWILQTVNRKIYIFANINDFLPKNKKFLIFFKFISLRSSLTYLGCHRKRKNKSEQTAHECQWRFKLQEMIWSNRNKTTSDSMDQRHLLRQSKYDHCEVKHYDPERRKNPRTYRKNIWLIT